MDAAGTRMMVAGARGEDDRDGWCGSFHGYCCGANVVRTTNDGSASMVDSKLV